MTYVMKALELEDTIKNYERRDSNGWFVFNSLISILLCFIYAQFVAYGTILLMLMDSYLGCIYLEVDWHGLNNGTYAIIDWNWPN